MCRLVSILYCPAIRAPALPSVLESMSLASMHGKAGARIRMPHQHANLALTLMRLNSCLLGAVLAVYFAQGVRAQSLEPRKAATSES